MKKTIARILLMTVLPCFAAGCESFLDVQHYVKDMTQYDSVFVKRTTTEQWLWDVYSSLDNTPSLSNGYLYYASDESIFVDSDGTCEQYQNCTYSPTNQLFEDRYSALYTGIRTASIFIHNVYKCEELSQVNRERMEGEARFLRAFFYFTLVSQYGPVPLVPDEGQDISLSYEELALPRAPMDQLVEFMVADLERAARVLPTEYSTSYVGRVTQGAALALRAKVLLYAASPLYNGNTDMFEVRDDQGNSLISQTVNVSKWARAAAAAKEVIDLGFYELYFAKKTEATIPLASNVPTDDFPNGAGNIDPYQSYRELFDGDVPITINNEFIFARLGGAANPNILVNNSFPYSHRGVNKMGTTMKQVNAYYMRDGRDRNQSSEEYPYYTSGFTDGETGDPFVPANCHRMWLNREPRFYASIAYNGCVWENATADASLQNFRCNYYRSGADGKTLSRPYNYPPTGIGILKFYNPEDSWDEAGRQTHKAHPIIRYADVLLWYAEALNELPDGETYTYSSVLTGTPITITRDVSEMRRAFSQVRFRAGLPDLGDAEYQSADTFRDRLKRERQIEFFMEGARYFDLRRWKDAEVEENTPVTGMNVDMQGTQTQRERFYVETPVQLNKVFMQKMYLWPFSYTEMQRNARLTQNPGW